MTIPLRDGHLRFSAVDEQLSHRVLAIEERAAELNTLFEVLQDLTNIARSIVGGSCQRVCLHEAYQYRSFSKKSYLLYSSHLPPAKHTCDFLLLPLGRVSGTTP